MGAWRIFVPIETVTNGQRNVNEGLMAIMLCVEMYVYIEMLELIQQFFLLMIRHPRIMECKD